MRPPIFQERLHLGRREFLRILAALSAFLPAPWLLASVPGKSEKAPPALGPYLDTLLPEDESPSATQLGLVKRIMSLADADPRLARVIELGCTWLDRAAVQFGAEDFAGLEEAGRITVVSRAERSAARSLPRVFFTVTLDRAFQEYYTQAAAWESLGYKGPPQPRGFPNQHLAPGARP